MNTFVIKGVIEHSRYSGKWDDGEDFKDVEIVVTCDAVVYTPAATAMLRAIYPNGVLKDVSIEEI